ncbi:MAG TPA: hypothetical protein ENK33_08525 [Desulfobacterales bacterium]|nr:hypothetical protein [Desulfobacterales bacterium]
MKEQEIIIELTECVRNAEKSFAIGIRRCLEEKGVAVEKAIIADLFPDDYCFDFGLVVTEGDDVYQFGYAYPPNKEQIGKFTEWNKLTGNWRNTPYAEQIKTAFSLKYRGT